MGKNLLFELFFNLSDLFSSFVVFSSRNAVILYLAVDSLSFGAKTENWFNDLRVISSQFHRNTCHTFLPE